MPCGLTVQLHDDFSSMRGNVALWCRVVLEYRRGQGESSDTTSMIACGD